jgi:hypothetical protein
MSEAITLFPEDGADYARITVTEEHTVINGSHIQVSNGYTHKKVNAATVSTKDILSVERQTLRIKRFLVIGLVLFGFIFVVYGIFDIIGRVLIITGDDDRAAMELFISYYGDEIFGDIAHEIIADYIEAYHVVDAIGRTIEGDLSWISPVDAVEYTIYAILLFGAVIFVGRYVFKPLHVLRITAMGGDFAFETKHYQDNEVDRFIASVIKHPSILTPNPP